MDNNLKSKLNGEYTRSEKRDDEDRFDGDELEEASSIIIKNTKCLDLFRENKMIQIKMNLMLDVDLYNEDGEMDERLSLLDKAIIEKMNN